MNIQKYKWVEDTGQVPQSIVVDITQLFVFHTTQVLRSIHTVDIMKVVRVVLILSDFLNRKTNNKDCLIGVAI